ncbi:TPA: hypothetical protein DEO28_00585 [Candidatus Dependentiae bacterium]|nr:MAG: Long-chain fatty-acid-CoA ligase [candidate division TM6 bacterium GW2011_GWE2_31_21]KKP54088.1 MAG: Long-chain fatty-acid-CoA ligase [candidate division TM6 bacterium GW2011_GWF2_33_332]HBS48330.1 hypothetical protein [Candidatus Dependentiae bacterium]HBZ72996.1 hypothetical protein [Candidatus Dependentiae bacterium]
MGVLQKLKAYISRKSLILTEVDVYKFLENFLNVDTNFYVGTILKTSAERFLNKNALIFCGRSISYKELYFRSILMSKKLQNLGVKPGDKVLLLFENSIDFYISYFSIWQVGAVCVPLNTFLHEKELSLIIKDSKPNVVISSNNLKSKFDLAKEFVEENFPIILTNDDIDFETELTDQAWEECKNFKIEKLSSNALCLLLYTSGSTGSPKGVMLSSENIITNVMQDISRLSSIALKVRESVLNKNVSDEKFFAALPLFHVFAQNTCIWFPIIIGASIIIIPKIDRKEIVEGLREKPTLFFGVPALYALLCLMKNAPLDSIKIFVSGGDAMTDKIRGAFSIIYGRKICVGYGLTEASPVVAIQIQDKETSANIVGKLLLGIRAEIRDDEGNVLKNCEIGNLWLHGKNIMLGYYNSPKETEKVLKDGWLNTGDLARFDKSGSLEIMGRTKDLIIHKGFNIYPQEIENVLLSHPAVFKAAVIGRDDVTAGQVPVAFIAIRPGNDDVKLKLKEYCGNYLAAYKIPRKFIYLNDLPMNPTGKIDKKQLTKDL